jgi:hypothetical protein
MIGVIDQPIASAVQWKTCPPIRWLSARSQRRYLADPFPWPGSSDEVLCENYDFTTRLGCIKRLKIKDDRIVSETIEKFPLPGHLSFPFLFEHEGSAYALPESAAAREMSLFRWEPEKKEWNKIASPLKDVAAADSVLFRFGDLFWIAYTDVEMTAAGNLNLLYAPSLAGPWQPHASNPVVRGTESSRCGGTPFYVGDTLYRPAQDCSRCYGWALRIMRILECSPAAFREEEVARVSPVGGENPHGIHTLSAWGDRCLVDGKRWMFSPGQVLGKIGRRLARICASL